MILKQQTILFVTLLLVLLPSLLSCNVSKAPIGCTQIQEETLRSLDFGRMTLTDFQLWFNSSPFREGKLEIIDYLEESKKSATWMYKDIKYMADFRGGTLVRIDVAWARMGKVTLEPTSAGIINCFGPPDLYQASYLTHVDAKIFDLGLWYLNKGVVIKGSHHGKHWVDWPGRPPPLFDEKVTMTYMIIVAPGTAEEMIKSVYTYGDRDDVREKVLKTLRSWPGAWEKIMVDTD